MGAGTEFKIKLPLTLAIITGLLVRLSGRTFVIPMSNIAEIVRMEEGRHSIRPGRSGDCAQKPGHSGAQAA